MGNTNEVRRIGRTAMLVATMTLLATVAAFAAASPAAAKPCDPYAFSICRPIVKPKLIRTEHRKPHDSEIVIPNRQERDPLPVTGADLTLFAATGFAAIGTGTVLVRAARSRRARA